MLRVIVVLASMLAVGPAGQAAAAPSVARPPANAAQPRPVLVAFRGGFHLGGYRRNGYRYGFGGYGPSRPRSRLLHRAVKTAIWLYVLHLSSATAG